MNKTKNIAVFASGTGSNFENIIRYFDGKEVNIIALFSDKQHCKAVEIAAHNDIETFLFFNKELQETDIVINYLSKLEIDLIILAGFLKKIPSNIIQRFSNKIINLHPSLLPKYGGKGMYGMNVHKAVIENKEIESGITIHYVNENYDEGNVIKQYKCDIDKDDSPEILASKIKELEQKYFPLVIDSVLNGTS